MPSVLAAAAPSSSLVIRREKRRRRKNAPSSPAASAAAKRPRRGFVFSDASASEARRDESDSDAWRPAAAAEPARKQQQRPATSRAPATASTFSYRVKHGEGGDSGGFNADAASAALREQREKAEKLEQRRLRLQKRKEESEREARLEAEVQEALTADQGELYRIVRAQVKRELRKTKKQFAASSGRHDVISLTEKTMHALKLELIAFMRTEAPSNETVKLPNPENARLRALIDTHEKQLEALNKEEKEWAGVKARVEAEKAAAATASEETSAQRPESIECELQVTREIEELQRAAIKRFDSTTRKLDLLEASMSTIDQLIVEAEVKKAALFSAFHDSAFKGYANMTQPKENLRAMLKYSDAS